MGKTSVRLLSCLLVLSVVGVTLGELIGQWKFDEGAGTIAADSSGNNHPGTILGTPEWVADRTGAGSALGFNPVTCTGVDCGMFDPTKGTGKFSLALWAFWDGTGTFQHFFTKSNGWGQTTMMFQVELWGAHTSAQYTDRVGISYDPASVEFCVMPKNEWAHLAFVYDGANLRVYLNGRDENGPKALTIGANMGAKCLIGRDFDGGRVFCGAMSDVRLYSHPLTTDEVAAICPPPRTAKNPNPADGAVGVQLPLFRWEAGYKSMLHEVYIGTSPELGPTDLAGPRSPAVMLYYQAGLKPGTTYYWRVDEIEADMKTVNKGEVWSFTTQDVKAYLPSPSDGNVDVAPAPMLTWQPGTAATKHHVYFGTDSAAVTQGAAATDKGEVAETSFAPGTLENVTTYYWRVDETVAGVGGGIKTGPVWSFTTYMPVDDFESYTDKEGSCVFDAWVDGYTNKLSGSTVGNLASANGTYGETTIVHSGKQSMPMDYNNTKTPYYSEAERTWTKAQDWTAGGTEVLVLEIRGQGTNTPGPIYVGVRDSSGHTATVTHPTATAYRSVDWLTWKIPLSAFSSAGVKVTAIKSLYIGVGNPAAPAPNGAGRIYVDDIRLTKP